jgi:hypothetical protein
MSSATPRSSSHDAKHGLSDKQVEQCRQVLKAWRASPEGGISPNRCQLSFVEAQRIEHVLI